MYEKCSLKQYYNMPDEAVAVHKIFSYWQSGKRSGCSFKDEQGMSAFLLFLNERRVERAPFSGRSEERSALLKFEERLMLCLPAIQSVNTFASINRFTSNESQGWSFGWINRFKFEQMPGQCIQRMIFKCTDRGRHWR